MPTYTDIIGQPIQTGDTIAYADQRGIINITLVRAIVPLVKHPDTTGDRVFAREDQLRNRYPTRFTGKRFDDPSNRYVIQIMKTRWVHSRDGSGNKETKYTLPTNEAIVVPAGTVKKS